MSTQETARLIIQNCQIQSDSEDKECLITLAEEKELISRAQKNNQIHAINRMGGMYNLGIDYVESMNIRFLLFKLEHKELAGYLSACLMSLVWQLKLEEFNKGKIKTEVVLEKIRDDDYIKHFSIINSSNEKFFIVNPIIQNLFSKCIKAIKNYEKKVYQIDLLSQKAGFCIISPINKEALELQQREIESFVEHNELIELMDKMIRNEVFDLHKKTDDESFQHAFFHTRKAVELTEEEREESQKVVEKDLFKAHTHN